MAKPGRNDRCPCGSGKKYKACCLTKDEAVEHERLAAAQAQRENQAAEKRQSLREVRAAMLAKLAGEFAGDDGSDDDELFADDLCDDDPTDASNAVLALIHDGKLDEAEAAARALLAQYPDPRRLGSARHGSRKARRKPSSRRLLSKGGRVPRREPGLLRARIERRVRGPNRKTRPACHRLTSLPTITVRDGPALATTTNQDYRARSSPRMPWPGL